MGARLRNVGRGHDGEGCVRVKLGDVGRGQTGRLGGVGFFGKIQI